MDKQIDIFVGSKIGSFKHVKWSTDSTNNSKKFIENLQDIKTLQKDDCITFISWGSRDENLILVGRKNQQIQVYDTSQFTFAYTVSADFGEGEIIGLSKHKGRLIAALSGGTVKIWQNKKHKEIIFNTGGPLDRLRSCPDDTSIFATGGEENDLKIWRIGEDSPIYQAKNLAHDFLELRQSVWVSDMCFIPGNNGKLVAVCSRNSYVRLYDSRAQRRPVCNVQCNNMAATSISPSFDDRQVVVGFGRGQLHQFDLRMKGRIDKGFKGSVGAVTAIDLVRNPRLIVSTSLDRHLKIHDFDTKQLIYKQYMTSKLSCVLVQTETSTPMRCADNEEIKEEPTKPDLKSEDEMDELFNNMETISEKSKKRSISTEMSEEAKFIDDIENPIAKLLRSTERKKRKMEKIKKEKKSKSIFHNA